jgi:hypothetical protein
MMWTATTDLILRLKEEHTVDVVYDVVVVMLDILRDRVNSDLGRAKVGIA